MASRLEIELMSEVEQIERDAWRELGKIRAAERGE
jgi:hypothetical protein